MSESSANRRQQVLRVAVLFALAVGLAAVAFWFSVGGDVDHGPPLYPDDVFRLWLKASPARKRSTAEQLVERMYRDGNLGPRTLAKYEDPRERQEMIDALVAVLDAGTDKNSTRYASPGLSISFVATRATTDMGWRQ